LVGLGNFFKVKILIFLISLSSIYSQTETLNLPYWYLQNYDNEIKTRWAQYQPVALVAVLLSFTVASLLYGFGFILNNERLRNYGMAEFLESVASLLMVIFFLTLLNILISTFFPVVAEGATPEQKQIVKIGPFAYLDAKLALVQQISNKTFTQIVNLLYPLYLLSSIKIEPLVTQQNVIGGFWGKVQTFMPGFSTIANWMQFILNIFIAPLAEFAEFIFSGLKALSFQRALLKFFEESALTVFLPLGVVLRIFPPTRGAGGMLIAIAFSFFFIFPFIYFVFYLPSGSNSLYGVIISNLEAINKKLDELNSQLILKAIKATTTSGLLAVAISVLGAIPLLFSNIVPFFNMFISNFPTYLFVTSIIPVIAGAVTLTFISTLSDLFGENAVSYGQRLIGRIL